MAEVYDLLFGGPGKESLAGCKDIILLATQALLVGKLRYELSMTLSFLNLKKKSIDCKLCFCTLQCMEARNYTYSLVFVAFF